MMVRLLCSLGIGIAVGVVSMIASIFVDLAIRPHQYDGTAGMYGFVYGLTIAPVAGLLSAIALFLWLRHRAKQAEAVATPKLHEQ
jgi:uncharacterized membrane protein